MSKSSIAESRLSSMLDSDDESDYKRRRRRSRTEFQPTRWDRYYDSWFPEVAALCLSTICGVAIVVVLKTYHGKLPPEMHYGLTLNAIISILATTAKVAMIFSISSAMSQLKWIWFSSNKSRQLLDAEIFDEASRGPWGSIRLLSTHVSWSLAALGSVLTIVAVGFDPFVQQIISYPKTLHEDFNQAAVPVAKALIDMPSRLGTNQAIKEAFFGNLNLEISPTCPNGDCTFQDVSSIGWCSRCVVDSSWSLTGNCSLTITMEELNGGQEILRDCKATSSVQGQPEVGLGLQITPPDPANLTVNSFSKLSFFTSRIVTTSSIATYTEYNSSLTSIPSDQPILEVASLEALYGTSSVEPTLQVKRCSFDLCVNYIDAKVSSYTVSSKVTRSVNGFKTIQTGKNLYTSRNKFLCWTPQNTSGLAIEDYTELDGESTNLFSPPDHSFCGAQNSTPNWFGSWASELEGQVTGNTNSSFHRQIQVKQGQIANGDLNNIDQQTSYSGPIMDAIRSTDIEQIFGNISASLSSLVLDQSVSWNVTGIMKTWPTVVHVRGWWLIIPFVLYVGTIVFLVGVIHLSFISKAPLWKSSINVLFYHGLDHDMGLHSSLLTVPEMEARSTQMDARLVPYGRHERLVLETTMVRRASWTGC